MDKHELDKTVEELAEILSTLSDILDDTRRLRLRISDTMYDLENMRSDLEAFGDDLDEENEDD